MNEILYYIVNKNNIAPFNMKSQPDEETLSRIMTKPVFGGLQPRPAQLQMLARDLEIWI